MRTPLLVALLVLGGAVAYLLAVAALATVGFYRSVSGGCVVSVAPEASNGRGSTTDRPRSMDRRVGRGERASRVRRTPHGIRIP